SVSTAHITRLVAVLHVPPDTNDVGWSAASRAPARAALSIATCEWKIRARSAAAASRTRKIGRITASSTRAWPRRLGGREAARRPGASGRAAAARNRGVSGLRGAGARRFGRGWLDIGRRDLAVTPSHPLGGWSGLATVWGTARPDKGVRLGHSYRWPAGS